MISDMSLLSHIPLPGQNASLLATFAALAWQTARSRAEDQDAVLLERLREGDEEAFLALVGRHQTSMLRLARSFVSSAAVAEEVVQDTWLGVLRGIDGFAGRSTFKTWLLRILVNRAKSTGVREDRSISIGLLFDPEHNLEERIIAEQFLP